MQVLKEEVRAKILKVARKMFIEHGYENTSMKMIANKAGVSKSNLYNYYSAKEEIFCQLTKRAYGQIDALFNNVLLHDPEKFNMEDFRVLISQELIKLLTENREEILLLVDCSRGTRFENVKDELIKRLEEHYIYESKQFNIHMENEDTFFLHYVSAGLVEGLLEIIRHNKDDAWIKSNIELLLGYFINGFSYFFKNMHE
jgi:AcrR family transcriptional regulator